MILQEFEFTVMPSSTVNTSIIVPGNGSKFGATVSDEIREFSNFGDDVDLSNNVPTNLQTRMLGGNDIVTLSNIVTGGFSNRVNGNLGDDILQSKLGSQTRDFVVGGSENDVINLAPSTKGADWQNGQNGNDIILGADSTDMSILRGGANNDEIYILGSSKHIAVGDLGRDRIFLDGAAAIGRIICRTDGEAAPQNINEADTITEFSLNDKVYIPGIESLSDLERITQGTTTYLAAEDFTNGTTGLRFIVGFEGRSSADVNDYIVGGNIIIGTTADAALAAAKPDQFLADPNLGGIFA